MPTQDKKKCVKNKKNNIEEEKIGQDKPFTGNQIHALLRLLFHLIQPNHLINWP